MIVIDKFVYDPSSILCIALFIFTIAQAIKMPMIHVVSNVDVPEGFEIRLTEIMSEAMDKPKESILVQVTANARMVHGAVPGPCAHIWVKSMGHMSGHLNNVYTEKITTLVNKETGIPKNKIVIEYYDLHGDYIGFNGATVSAAAQK